MLALVALTLLAPVALAAGPDDPCICDPHPCGPSPGIVADPAAYAAWVACGILGGEPW